MWSHQQPPLSLSANPGLFSISQENYRKNISCVCSEGLFQKWFHRWGQTHNSMRINEHQFVHCRSEAALHVLINMSSVITRLKHNCLCGWYLLEQHLIEPSILKHWYRREGAVSDTVSLAPLGYLCRFIQYKNCHYMCF